MGAGMPEYLLIFRKPPSDLSNGYADRPVKKDKKLWRPGHLPRPILAFEGSEADDAATAFEAWVAGDWENETGYSRARWQFDAHGFMRSSGDRPLAPEDLDGLPAEKVFKLFRRHSLRSVYDFELDVALAEHLEARGSLPPTFMLLQPQSWHPDAWTDITRMRTLNGAQAAKGREMHLCPLQFDIADRAISQYSMPGELVLDPFGGLMTVPARAIKLGRRARGIELAEGYFRDGAAYVEAEAAKRAVPTLFDLVVVEAE